MLLVNFGFYFCFLLPSCSLLSVSLCFVSFYCLATYSLCVLVFLPRALFFQTSLKIFFCGWNYSDTLLLFKDRPFPLGGSHVVPFLVQFFWTYCLCKGFCVEKGPGCHSGPKEFSRLSHEVAKAPGRPYEQTPTTLTGRKALLSAIPPTHPAYWLLPPIGVHLPPCWQFLSAHEHIQKGSLTKYHLWFSPTCCAMWCSYSILSASL